MGPAFERAAARAGWLLTNDPDGNLILAAIDAPGPGEASLADDFEAAAVFRQALQAGEPYARGALRNLLAYGPGDHYVIDLLGGYTAAQAYLRQFSTHRILGTEADAATGRLAMIADRPLQGFTCDLITSTTATASQVLVDYDNHAWIAANHTNHAWVIRWTDPADALREERHRRAQLDLDTSARTPGSADPTQQELLASWLRHEPSSILVPIVSLDTTVTATAITAALDQAGIDITELAIHRTLDDKASMTLPGITIGPGRYNPEHPSTSSFDFDNLSVRATGQPSEPIASLGELTHTVAVLQALAVPTPSAAARVAMAPAHLSEAAALAAHDLPAGRMTKAELLGRIQASGRRLSDRNLTYYTSQGLLPPLDRAGGGHGRYPTHLYELACWIIDCRATGLAVPAIRELAPLHHYLTTARTGTARQDDVQVLLDQITNPQAIREVPWLVTSHPLTWDTPEPTLTAGGRTWTPGQSIISPTPATRERPTLRRAPTAPEVAITS